MGASVNSLIRRLTRIVRGGLGSGAPPLSGYQENRREIPFVDPLSDAELTELNGLLRWNAFTVDRHGRRFGGVAWKGKRDRSELIPDRRIVQMDERFDLSDKHVLEFGCFEGIHTIGLTGLAARVTAVDGRVENVVKTIVRAALYGCHPTVFVYDVERRPADVSLLGADLLHHVGVLYHLADPVGHLLEIGRYVRLGLMLDTHYAADGEARHSYEVEGKSYPYRVYGELGHRDVFSGLRPHSKWLPLDLIVGLLRDTGFGQVEIAETRLERNGPRVLLFARRG